MVRVTLDAETFKALASPTRLGVLRTLDERRKTLTEISRDLNLNKATVHEHLGLLAAADLVRKRDDEGRKWIYYELTWRGQKLLHPQETTTFNVLLGLGVAAAGGGLGMLARSLYLALEPSVDAPAAPPTAGADGDADGNPAAIAADKAASEPQGATGTQGTYATSTASQSGTGTTTSPAAAGAGAASSTDTGAQAMERVLVDNTGAAAPSDVGLLDDLGTLGLALLAFAALMGILAWVLRRHLRADPFRPPPGPPGPPAPPGQ